MLCTQLKDGQSAQIERINLNLISKRRCFHLGITEGEMITKIKKAPLKDPTIYYVNGNYIALRHQDAMRIEVRTI